MSIKKAPPGSGGGRRTHFPYVPTRRGEKWTAYCAGPCHWVMAHDVNRKTKVCAEWLTDGELVCEHCSPINGPIEKGYQPLYRQSDGRPVMVLVSADVRETVDKLRFHKRVQVAREKEASAGLYIVELLEQNPKFESTLPERHASPDLTNSLLAIWGMEAVKRWYYGKHRPSDKPVSLPEGVAVRDDGTPYSAMSQAAAKRWAPSTVKAEPLDVEYDRVKENLKKKASAEEPHTNGKHKPKG